MEPGTRIRVKFVLTRDRLGAPRSVSPYGGLTGTVLDVFKPGWAWIELDAHPRRQLSFKVSDLDALDVIDRIAELDGL